MKAKLLKIPAELLLMFIKPGVHRAYQSIKNSLPEDARITGVRIPFDRPFEIWLRVESETFPETKGEVILETLEPIIFGELRDGVPTFFDGNSDPEEEK